MVAYESRRDLQTPAANKEIYASTILPHYGDRQHPRRQSVLAIHLSRFPTNIRGIYDAAELERQWWERIQFHTASGTTVNLHVGAYKPCRACTNWFRPCLRYVVTGASNWVVEDAWNDLLDDLQVAVAA